MWNCEYVYKQVYGGAYFPRLYTVHQHCTLLACIKQATSSSSFFSQHGTWSKQKLATFIYSQCHQAHYTHCENALLKNHTLLWEQSTQTVKGLSKLDFLEYMQFSSQVVWKASCTRHRIKCAKVLLNFGRLEWNFQFVGFFFQIEKSLSSWGDGKVCPAIDVACTHVPKR